MYSDIEKAGSTFNGILRFGARINGYRNSKQTKTENFIKISGKTKQTKRTFTIKATSVNLCL